MNVQMTSGNGSISDFMKKWASINRPNNFVNGELLERVQNRKPFELSPEQEEEVKELKTVGELIHFLEKHSLDIYPSFFGGDEVIEPSKDGLVIEMKFTYSPR